MLRPPAASFARIPRFTRSLISRLAVSCEHLASFAHLDEVSLPSKPSSRRLTIFRCRSLNDSPAWASQNGLAQDGRERVLGAVEGAVEASEEPFQPGRDVQRALLCPLQDS